MFFIHWFNSPSITSDYLEDTYEVVKNRFSFRPLDVIAVKGKNRGVKIYQLLSALPGDPELAPTADDLKIQKLTEQAFNVYMNRNFKESLELYTELAKAYPTDPIGSFYIERCKEYIVNPPAANWDGVTHMKSK